MNSIKEDLENIINKTYLYARGAKKDYSCTEAVKELEEYINKVRKEDLKNIKSELERKSAEYRGLDKAGQALAEGFMMGRNACIDSVDKYIKLIRRNK